jgi:hypothetical protein
VSHGLLLQLQHELEESKKRVDTILQEIKNDEDDEDDELAVKLNAEKEKRKGIRLTLKDAERVEKVAANEAAAAEAQQAADKAQRAADDAIKKAGEDEDKSALDIIRVRDAEAAVKAGYVKTDVLSRHKASADKADDDAYQELERTTSDHFDAELAGHSQETGGGDGD